MVDGGLRLLHFFPSFSIGGQQRRLASLIGGLGPSFQHNIFALDGDLSGAAMLPAAPNVSLEAFVLAKSSLVGAGNVARLRSLLARAGADLLCTYNFGSIEAIIANRLGPRLPHVHHEDGFGPDEIGGRQKGRRVLARRLLLRRALVATPSAALEKIATQSWRLHRSRVRRIPVGIDLARYEAGRSRRADEIVIGSLGSLRAEKNFARLIRCFAAAAEGRAARLVIHGEGPARRDLERTRAASPASERIFLPGATSNPAKALAEMDIFALSSDTEQTPISLMEAMAAGLPSIATEVGDVRLMMGDAGADFVIAPTDEPLYAARLRALIDDAALRARLGAAARARAPIFDQTAMIAAFRALYHEAASASG